jgi:hypothetical protein
LETDGDKKMAQAIEGLSIEKIGGEIDGEGGGIIAELSQEREAIQARDKGDQLFDLLRL